MRYFLFSFCLFLSLATFAQEEIEYKEYSYTEFFQMIDDEKDATFSLKNAHIVLDTITDVAHTVEMQSSYESDYKTIRKDTITINKALRLENVFFEGSGYLKSSKRKKGALHNILFKENVDFKNCLVLLQNNTFDKDLIIYFDENISDFYPKFVDASLNSDFLIENNRLKGRLNIYTGEDKPLNNWSFRLLILKNLLITDSASTSAHFFQTTGIEIVELTQNVFKGDGNISFITEDFRVINISNNNFNETAMLFGASSSNPDKLIIWKTNTYKKPVLNAGIGDLKREFFIDWHQFKGGIVNSIAYYEFSTADTAQNDVNWINVGAEKFNRYRNSFRVENADGFKRENMFLGKFYDFYKDQHDIESANAVYREIKDLETERLKYLNQQNPSFDSFFTLKINQFLKVFSAYGTKPSKAIIFSLYVILTFALVYLFFPNHWDSHGKNRIIDRFSFFLKYMKKDAGMHDVYLEEKQGDILAYDEYKQLLESSGKDVPKFFQATGLPLYKWAISGTKLTAQFLSRVDVMKGTWSELPQSKRIWKSILLITVFLISIAYDLLIKMLNALMLSINTFTTLGFGEIPIKGLPRYLAIIQGFIGWFMLTIFSVSLISQLLN